MTKTEVKWSERILEWRNSGKGAQEFAAGRSYKASTLQWWASELRRRGKGGGRPGEAAVGETEGAIALARVVTRGRPRELGSMSAATAPHGVVVEVSGARISLTRGFDAELFSEVVRALAGAR